MRFLSFSHKFQVVNYECYFLAKMSAVFLEIAMSFHLDLLFVYWFIYFPAFPALPGARRLHLSGSSLMTGSLRQPAGEHM